MSNIAKTLMECAKIEGKCNNFHAYKNDDPQIYHSYDTKNHLCEVIDCIINRISHFVPSSEDNGNGNEDEEDDEYSSINMIWNETYDMVWVCMNLNIPFWTIFVHYGKLDYMVCDIFNQKLNEIGFQLYTVPEIDEGTDGVGGPDSMSFTLKLYPD